MKAMEINSEQQRRELLELARTRMPFGKYKERLLVDLPEPYLVWFKQKGFPKGKLGKMLELMLEIKFNGLENIIREINKNFNY
ncbi:DUF3820 family protein [Prolixibacter sp. NT017]|uniref:DUF3820 family protein n=1 Tax=Prolixibacter sp. NT017 TaxID=2652390 RepID=UPI0012812F25|nr:DUF3820 family protein [Prolixibacter sp. NT017]GET25283.1 hypothetical protein NT017_16120 [Prolixibacter sp. NT017]